VLPKLRDILAQLEIMAPTGLAETWDNPGLQVGSYTQEVRKILVALDPTLNALASALEKEAQVLLTHHPLIFGPLTMVDVGAYPGNVIREALGRGISVVAAHTNLDYSKGGLNDILGDLLGLKNVEVLDEPENMDGAGVGRIGDLPEPADLARVAEQIKRLLGTERLRMAGLRSAVIRRVAVVGGSGGNLVSLAKKRGADLLLTGDVSHHHALEAESHGIALMDGGHFHTERTAIKIMAARLEALVAASGWEVSVEMYEDETNPLYEV
jgi:dinuclear metal center YbgI/SA1388 family protein